MADLSPLSVDNPRENPMTDNENAINARANGSLRSSDPDAVSDKYADLRAALSLHLGKLDLDLYGDRYSSDPYGHIDVTREQANFIAAAHPKTIRALLAERDALREAGMQANDALKQCTDALLHDGVPADMAHPKRQAIVAADIARAALAQNQS